MHYCNDPGFYGWFIFPIGFGIFILILFWRRLWWRGKYHGHGWRDVGLSPLDMIKKRYAVGDINETEYHKLKKELNSSHEQNK